jgi:aspartyl/asparaginyl beta-hydroxylase (cupin superfamily)
MSTDANTPLTSLAAEPPFWDDQLHRMPWAVDVRSKGAQIKEEVIAFIKRYRPFMPYPKYGDLYVNTWDAFPLSIFQGEHIELSRDKLEMSVAPLVSMFRSKLSVTSSTIAELEEQGHLRNVFVSRLVPNSTINPHRGWTPDYLRVHLCLVSDPACQITVGDVTRTWQVGELLAFKDGGPYLHSVKHRGQNERIILSYDLHLNYVSRFIPEIHPRVCAATPEASSATGTGSLVR